MSGWTRKRPIHSRLDFPELKVEQGFGATAEAVLKRAGFTFNRDAEFTVPEGSLLGLRTKMKGMGHPMPDMTVTQGGRLIEEAAHRVAAYLNNKWKKVDDPNLLPEEIMNLLMENIVPPKEEQKTLPGL